MPKLHGRDAEKKWVDLSGSGSGGAGTPGKDGYSPTATVEQTEDGAVVTITDKSGTTTATLTNGRDGVDGQPGRDGIDGQDGAPGKDGADGQPGKDGSDGVSPTVSVTNITGGHRIAITDKNGTKNVDVMDGSDGKDGSPGAPGKDGTSITVTETTESEEDGGENVVTFSDGTRITIKNGSAGSPGEDGADGETPEMTVMRVDSSDGVGRGYVLVTFTLGEEQKSFTVYDGSAGYPGKDGVGIESIEKVSSDGLVDTYKITYTPVSGGASDPDPTYFAVTNGSPGKDGADGAPGKDGAAGTPGKDGADGQDGKDGTSVTVSNVSESDADGGSNVVTFSDGKNLTVKNGKTGAQGPTGDTGATGATGQRGTGLLPITTAPSAHTTAVNGITPAYRIALSTVKTQASVTEVFAGDTVRYSYYHYPIVYVDASYAYCGTRVSIRGATGKAGTDASVTAENIAAALGYTPVDPARVSLGIHTDGLIYVFIDGVPVGNGIEMTVVGDISCYLDSENHIILKENVEGALPDGTYTAKWIMPDGSTIDIGTLSKDTNVYYTVTNALTNCTNSNSATQVIAGQSYSATITAKSGYELKTVTATMGGNAVTVTEGVINIENVTGNVVITAVAEEKAAAEPVTVDIGITKDYSITLDTGALRGSTSAGYGTTDFIALADIPKPCTINLTGGAWAYANTSDTGYVRFFVADKSDNKLAGDYTHYSKMPAGVTMVYNDTARNDITVTVTSENIGKIRFAGAYGIGGSANGTNNFADMKATLTYTPDS